MFRASEAAIRLLQQAQARAEEAYLAAEPPPLALPGRGRAASPNRRPALLTLTPAWPRPWRENLASLMMTARGPPWPTGPFSSRIATVKVSLRPSTAISSLSQVTCIPTGVGGGVLQRELGAHRAAARLQFRGYALPAGLFGQRGQGRRGEHLQSAAALARAVFAAVTATVAVPQSPASSIVFSSLQGRAESAALFCAHRPAARLFYRIAHFAAHCTSFGQKRENLQLCCILPKIFSKTLLTLACAVL